MRQKPSGIESGIALIQGLLARGEIDEQTAELMRRRHLALVYDLTETEAVLSPSEEKP